MSDRALWLCLAAGGVLSIAVCLAVAQQSLILGAPGAGWVYGYVGHFSSRPIGAALLVTGVCSALLLYLPSDSRRHWPLIVVWILVATALHALLRSLTPVTLEEIFASDAANSFYSVTQEFSAQDVLSNFERARALWPLHAQSNMPGKLMFVYGLQAIARDPAALAWLVALASNLGAALMYLVARDLFDDRRVALFSMILYLFVP